jgi:putative Mn2+ efflux pump MntP
VMSMVGMCLGRVVGRLIRIRADLLSGVTLIVAAIVLPLAFGG